MKIEPWNVAMKNDMKKRQTEDTLDWTGGVVVVHQQRKR